MVKKFSRDKFNQCPELADYLVANAIGNKVDSYARRSEEDIEVNGDLFPARTEFCTEKIRRGMDTLTCKLTEIGGNIFCSFPLRQKIDLQELKKGFEGCGNPSCEVYKTCDYTKESCINYHKTCGELKIVSY